MKDGFNTFCIECHKADNIARKAIRRAEPEFHAAELASKAEYRKRTVEIRSSYMLGWRESNKEHIVAYAKTYRQDNKEHYNFLCQKRKLDKLKRTPAWLTEDDLWAIAEAYDLAALRTQMLGVQFHVDHIIPLRGKKVSGLHVPQNIRVIPGIENMRKTNKFEV
jgi:hypothetical protein